MNPITALKRLLGVACAGLIAIPLTAQTPTIVRNEPAPVTSQTAGTGLLCGGTVGLRGPGPLGTIDAHLCGFHFYSGDLQRAVRVEHYCSSPRADILQCVIYDTDQPNARLIGVEYIISESLFNQLPAEEKKLWHSHRYEVMSGLLTAPGLPAAAERAMMKMFVTTYGKTWTLWQVDRGDKIPLGLPKLMMGFTADGQLDPKLAAARDRDRNIDPAKVKAQRADLPTRPVATGADEWQKGPAFQINDDWLQPTQPAPKP